MRNAGDRVAGGSSGRRNRPASPEPAPPAANAAGASLFTPAYRVSHGPPAARPGTYPDPDQAGSAAGSGPADPGRRWPGQAAGYSAGSDADRDVSWLGDELSAGFGWGDDDPSAGVWPGAEPGGRGQARRNASNAVRGFPPAPGEPLPVYPPGPFEAWNRVPDRPVTTQGADGTRGDADEAPGRLTSATITPDEFDTDYSLPAIKDPVAGTAAASAGGATMTEPASAAGSRSGATRTGPLDVPGEPVRRGSAAGRPPGPGHRAPGRSRAGARPRPAGTRDDTSTGPDTAAGAVTASDQAGAAPLTRAETALAKTPGGRRRPSHWLAIGAAIVIIIAVAAVLVYTLPKSKTASPPPKPKSTSTPSPTATGPSAPPGPWGFIGARKTDATPLTLAEVFPATISDGTRNYAKARQVNGKDCHASLIGTALQSAVRNGGCTQALRATYVSKAAKVMGTIGVFNLKNAAEAGKAAAKAGHSQFVAQLAAKSGPAKSIGQGTGLEEAIVKGHYLVLVWAEPTNISASPSGKNKKLNAFMNLLVAHTVNVSLSYRMVDGKPPPSR